MIKGAALLPPQSHPEDQPAPGPAGRVPASWESLLHSLAFIIWDANRSESLDHASWFCLGKNLSRTQPGLRCSHAT